jgi:hypothetical protein
MAPFKAEPGLDVAYFLFKWLEMLAKNSLLYLIYSSITPVVMGEGSLETIEFLTLILSTS